MIGAFACSRRAFVPDKLPAFIALIKANPQDPAYIQDHRREAGVTLAFRAMERCGWDRQLLRFPFNTIPHRPLRCKDCLTGSKPARNGEVTARSNYICKASVDLPVDNSR